jgi:hypothetical protein
MCLRAFGVSQRAPTGGMFSMRVKLSKVAVTFAAALCELTAKPISGFSLKPVIVTEGPTGFQVLRSDDQ